MQLTGKEIINEGLLTNWIVEGVQQQGVDVRIDKVWRLKSDGFITTEKTHLPDRELVEPIDGVYSLDPGYYEFSMVEGCNIKPNVCMYLKHRSSLIRCGVAVYSGQFDAGFSTNSMGAFMEVKNPAGVRIERNARVAQTIFTRTNSVENLYDGQWQNDKQRR